MDEWTDGQADGRTDGTDGRVNSAEANLTGNIKHKRAQTYLHYGGWFDSEASASVHGTRILGVARILALPPVWARAEVRARC